MKIGVSLADELVEFADSEAERRGTTRSGLLAELLDEARVRAQTRALPGPSMAGTWRRTRPPGATTSAPAWPRNTPKMTGETPLPRRGEVWWVRVDKRRPAVIVQTDKVREPRIASFLVVPLTSRLHLEGLPGNVRLDTRSTRLKKPSVANVYDLQKVLKSDLIERVGELRPGELDGTRRRPSAGAGALNHERPGSGCWRESSCSWCSSSSKESARSAFTARASGAV